MKKTIIFLLVLLLGVSAFSQRRKVKTYNSGINYRKQYSHIIEAAYVNDSTHLFIGGNLTDKASASDEISGHKIYASSSTLPLIKNKKANPSGGSNKILLTDFTIHPTTNLQYGAGTGIYYPSGVDNNAYPFLGIYNKETLEIDSFVYYNIQYPGVETARHAIGLRVLYSSSEEAYYICGVMANKKFQDIDKYNLNVRTKGFILKADANDAQVDTMLVFSPDSVNNNAWLSIIGDIELNPRGTKIAFTGINTRSSLSGYHHPMTGMIDLDLNLQWCKAYEITSAKYAGIDVEFDDDDATLLVLQNTTTSWFSVMELGLTGAVLQGPYAYKFTGDETTNDTTRAHKIHYHNDTVIITGNHFADTGSGQNTAHLQYLFRFDIKADTLNKTFSDFTYYSVQEEPNGNQKPTCSYWAPENSVYLNDSLYMVGVYNEYTSNFGFKCVRVNGIDPNCVDTLTKFAVTPQLDDTLSCEATKDTCGFVEVDITHANLNVYDTLECASEESALLQFYDLIEADNLWEIVQVSKSGIDAVLISDQPTRYYVIIYNILGMPVYENEFDALRGETPIKMKFEVKPSVYLIKVSNGINTSTKKLINYHLR